MSLWHVDESDGVAVATYENAPMNYFCVEGIEKSFVYFVVDTYYHMSLVLTD